MHELLDVANAFGTPLKVAWIAWLAWGVGMALWYRHERASAAAPKLPKVPAALRAPRRVPSVKKQKPVEPVVGRLITPQHVDAEPKVEQPVPPVPSAPPVPAFDPAKAIVETFDPREHSSDSREHSSLDAIVADMEAHMPRVGADASHAH